MLKLAVCSDPPPPFLCFVSLVQSSLWGDEVLGLAGWGMVRMAHWSGQPGGVTVRMAHWSGQRGGVTDNKDCPVLLAAGVP